MIFAITGSGERTLITKQTRDVEYQRWLRQLAPKDFHIICDALNHHIDTVGGGEIVTSSWVPGRDWTDTPFQPIYVAVGQNWDCARFFFGLILWGVLMRRPEAWSFGRYPREEGAIIGMTYFRIEI